MNSSFSTLRTAATIGALSLVIMVACSTLIYSQLQTLTIDNEQRQHFNLLLISLSVIVCALTTTAAYFWARPCSTSTNKAKNNNKTHTLLIVDDNPSNRLVLTNILPNEKLHLMTAKNGQDAINQFKQYQPDLILMDLEMPGVNGFEALKAIRSLSINTRRIPMIAVSAHPAEDKRYEALMADFDDYLSKPIKQTDTDKLLSRWLDNYQTTRRSKNNTEKTHNTNHTDTVIQQIEKHSSMERSKQAAALHHNDPFNPNTENENRVNLRNGLSRKSTTSDFENTEGSALIANIVSIEKSLEYSNKNRELAKDMLHLLINMLKDEQANIVTLYKEHKWKALGQLTHKIYGGSCYCGVENLQACCSEADRLLQNTPEEKIGESDIDAVIERLLNAIDKLLLWDDEYDIDVIFE